MASKLLFHAINQGDLQQAQCLILEGCADVNYQNTLGEAALHIAAMRGLGVMAEVLLENGADPNVARGKEFGCSTPLHIATESGFIRVVEVLLAHNGDPNITNSIGMTPLHIACRLGNEVLALLLLAHGTHPDTTDMYGKPPSYYSTFNNHTAITRHLPPCHYSWKETRAKESSRIHFVEKAEPPKPERRKKKGK